MGFHVNESQFDACLTEQQKTYDIYAPKCFTGGNTFSDVDCTRYGKVNSISEIVFDRKSEYSFKEVLTPHFPDPVLLHGRPVQGSRSPEERFHHLPAQLRSPCSEAAGRYVLA